MRMVPIESFENSIFESAFLSVLGDRENQEDSFALRSIESNHNSLFIVCDGMGGSSGGELASQAAVEYFIHEYDNGSFERDIVNALENITCEADLVVSNLKDSLGQGLQAGTTLATVILDNKDMYWSSVGDSRIYLLRQNELVPITVDHNYKEYLKEKFKSGEITQTEFEKEMSGPRSDALLSFLGLNGLELINRNINPLSLLKDDVVILMSDGLYKVLDEDEIVVILNNFKNVNEAVLALESKAENKAKMDRINRDNTTIGLIKIK